MAVQLLTKSMFMLISWLSTESAVACCCLLYWRCIYRSYSLVYLTLAHLPLYLVSQFKKHRKGSCILKVQALIFQSFHLHFVHSIFNLPINSGTSFVLVWCLFACLPGRCNHQAFQNTFEGLFSASAHQAPCAAACGHTSPGILFSTGQKLRRYNLPSEGRSHFDRGRPLLP